MSRVCIVGLGYVGLPLAHAIATGGHDVCGYDINTERIDELKRNQDSTGELTEEQLKGVTIEFTTDPACMRNAQFIILAIPTPVNAENKPDLTLLKAATETVGSTMQKDVVVVYESTVYPGTTEEICGPLLEKSSGMTCGKDFTLGYSPERVNPGDREHTVRNITKIVAGQDEGTTDKLCELYRSVTKTIHRAPSIQVAEMAKAIENAQRDLNIAFVNEVAMMCNRMGISTKDVLDAAETKWNFLPFKPGLVGGHCIGVDPYYLVEKAEQLHMKTRIITAGRAMNDSMASYVATQINTALGAGEKRILILGLTFKENIPDTRNAKAGAVAHYLSELGNSVEMHDTHLDEETIRSMGFVPGTPENGPYDAIVLLVPHRKYLDAGEQALIRSTREGGMIYDLKSVLNRGEIEKSGRTYLAL